MKEIFEIIIGNYTWIQLLGFLWFFFIGYLFYGLNEITLRDPLSKHTPKKWKWKFWIKDNWRRYLVTILATYILFRFYIEFKGHSFGDFDALSMGLIGDGIGATAKKRINIIKVNRKKLMNLLENQEKEDIG